MAKTPWNKNKSVGQKKGFTPRQIEILREFLENKEEWMELALLNTGIDTMLRASDLLKLRVEDVLDWKGNIKDEINIKQKKTSSSHIVALSDKSKQTLKKWIKESNKYEDDYIFTLKYSRWNKMRSKPMNRVSYANIVKKWCDFLHLDYRDYSTHSLRRTRAVLLYKKGINIETIRILLGQKNIASTQNYLGIDRADAMEINKQFLI
jgi:integrase